MIAQIRDSKQRRPTPPLVRARQMVAETLFSDAAVPPRSRKIVRRAVVFALLAIIAAAGAIYYLWR